MASWAEFEEGAHDLAEAGSRLFRLKAGPVAFLATCSSKGQPRIAPVCPILARGDLYLSLVTDTPKRRDLTSNGTYALHALLGANDEEFQVSGHAFGVKVPEERTAVIRAIPFAAYDPEHPIFRLEIECLWVRWENPGQPGSRPVRRSWSGARSCGHRSRTSRATRRKRT